MHLIAGRKRQEREEEEAMRDKEAITQQMDETSPSKQTIPGLITCEGPRGPRGDKGDTVSDSHYMRLCMLARCI